MAAEPAEKALVEGPGPVDAAHFRRVFSHLPTGVTVVTANGPDGPVGMAANSVTSLSLEPPLLLFCPARASATWPAIRSAGAFCVNVMAEGHADLSERFAARGANRFTELEYGHGPSGPALPDAIAWIECRVAEEHDGGDHLIVVAEVVAMDSVSDVDPLVFFRGGYGSFRRLEAVR